jgi:peptidoglycan/xylan/chitin deacetylase (PgdA/CDA1 family)
VFEHALPVLQTYQFTSTNYFVANQFDGSNVWDKQNGVVPSDLMSKHEMLAWAQAGQEVGSHTLDHVHLPELSLEAARDQLIRSRLVLSEMLGAEVTAFCYPYGDFEPEHQRLAQEAGYTNATTTARGLADISDDFYALPRVGIWRTTPLFRFLIQCLSQHENRRRA